MNAVLLDTGCIVALLDRSERYHKKCADLLANLPDTLITCEAVVAECCYLLRDCSGAAETVLANVAAGNFLVPFRLAERAAAVKKIMKKYADVPIDLADACLVDLAGQMKCRRILTLDSDFRIYRWDRTRTFELLIDLE